jgi:predicted amidohydrolase
MIVAVLQMQPAPADVEANLAQIAAAARSAALSGAALLVAPEMAVTGYAIWDDIARLAEPRDGPTASRLSALARDARIAVLAGLPEREGSAIYNAAALAGPDGATRFYRKCHLYGPREKAAFTPGSGLSPVFEVGAMRAGLCVCYDAEFPETARSLALAGADLLLVPTALPRSGPNDRVSRTLIPARALENHMFVAYAGLCGQENGQAYQGGSVIVGQDGEDLARAGLGPALLLAKLERNAHGGGEPDPYLTDRRPELYRLS